MISEPVFATAGARVEHLQRAGRFVDGLVDLVRRLGGSRAVGRMPRAARVRRPRARPSARLVDRVVAREELSMRHAQELMAMQLLAQRHAAILGIGLG
ncbi:hypothetical protein [Agromyces sp. NPDC058110]|uniref:hypothetical protein n=1 Tax=Agromyces sp. NPDC058110 TaxID=3346345 RepID=UPI0036DEAA68